MSVRRFRVYKKRRLMSGGHRYQFLRSEYMPRTQLDNVNQYTNLTVGVLMVNNADLESDITDYTFVGSQYLCDPLCNVVMQ